MRRIFVLVAISLVGSAHAKENWKKGLDRLDQPTPSGHWRRVIIHSHNLYSHDACTNVFGHQKKNIKEACLKEFRQALCKNHIDAIFITEHANKMGYVDFNEIVAAQPGDELIEEDGHIVESRQHCEDGHVVRFLPGAENSLMPIGLKRHPEPYMGDQYRAYRQRDLAALQNFKRAGALVGIPHTEEVPIERIKDLKPDFIEIYNLHANLMDPVDNFKLLKFFGTLGRYVNFLSNSLLEPDLMFLHFFIRNKSALKKWAQISLEHPTVGIMGSDAHQNHFSMKMPDKERLDGYRRIFRWFSNWVRVDGPVNRESLMSSIQKGDLVGAFEVFGTPEDFEFKSVDAGATLYVQAPFHRESSMLKNKNQPDIKILIFQATEKGWVRVAKTEEMMLSYSVTQPGVYRAEIKIRPRHLKRHLFSLGRFSRKWYTWIYFNPIDLR